MLCYFSFQIKTVRVLLPFFSLEFFFPFIQYLSIFLESADFKYIEHLAQKNLDKLLIL